MLTRLYALGVRVANSPRLLVTCILGDITLGGLAYSLIEHHGPVEGMWWAVVTGSTVGYGDQYPTTTAGRFVGMCVIVSCILFVAIATAQLSAKLIVNSDAWTDDEQEEQKRQLREIHAAIERLEALCQQQTTKKPSTTSARTSGPSTASSGTARRSSRSRASSGSASGTKES